MDNKFLLDAISYIASGTFFAALGYYSITLSQYSGAPINEDKLIRPSRLEKITSENQK